MAATQEQGIFSLVFSVAGDRKEYSVDWDHRPFPGVWSHRRRTAVGWELPEEIGRREQLVLISRFRLDPIQEELTLERIRRTSPQELLLMRRSLEMERGLPVHTVESDALSALAPTG